MRRLLNQCLSAKSASLIIGLSIAVMVTSCSDGNFLDATETGGLTEEEVFADSAYTVQFLTGIYEDVGFSSHPNRFGDGGLHAGVDESEPSQSQNPTASLQFATGSVNPAVITDDAWRTPYENIRAANKLLGNIGRTNMAQFRKDIIIKEAKILRAWYYSILLKHYGGVPVIGDSVYTTQDDINVERETYAETVDYILTELDEASESMSVRPTGTRYGRVGAGMAQALRARILLYAASPLHNGGGNQLWNSQREIELTGYPTNDPERWKRAADAALLIINSGEYDLYEESPDDGSVPGANFRDLFNVRPDNEYIFPRTKNGFQELESIWQPPTRNGGGGGFALQEMVDAFGMSNGKPIFGDNGEPAHGYDPNNPFANRDPRLEHSITYDQSMMLDQGRGMQPVNIYLRPDGSPSSNDAVYSGTPTGYYIEKMIDPEIIAEEVHGTERTFPLIRYAEVLLNYAEALNEYRGPTQEVYNALIQIRDRADIEPGSDNMYGLDPNMTKEEMREVIHNERRVELAYEGHRFWDVRRWMTASESQDKVMTGMEIVRGEGRVEHSRFDVRRHTFVDAMYFWPIPQEEIAKSPELEQNPGW